MQKLLTLLLASLAISALANEPVKECKPPINNQTLSYQKTTNTPIYFAGFLIEPPKPEEMAFFNEDLLLKYPGNKTISFSYATSILLKGQAADYDPVAIYKQAFGILPKQSKHNAEIRYITKWFKLCDQELISYKIDQLDYSIFRTNDPAADTAIKELDVMILGDPQEVYMIGFKGFSNSGIDKVLATIHKPTYN